MTIEVAKLRAKCRRTGIDPSQLAGDPIEQFTCWHREWMETSPPDPTACVLATSSAEGIPSVRWMRLSYVDHGFVFFTDIHSRKGQELMASSRAALCFGWLELARQVRIEGMVGALSESECDDYFRAQPRDMQLLVWVSDQGRVISDRKTLEHHKAELEARFNEKPISRRPQWVGYRLIPSRMELWQGRTDNLNDRIIYRRERVGSPWTTERLSP